METVSSKSARCSDSIVTQTTTGSHLAARNLLILEKAAVGIEPTNKGFAV
jgi:hypothetical protein